MLLKKQYLIFFCLIKILSAQSTETYYFYHPENDYGSEATFNPITVLFNGGFDVLRNGKNSKDISKYDYLGGAENVWNNVSHPIKNIEIIGWKRFLTSEVFPLNLKAERLQYFPNYGNHLIGHGMKFVRLKEWYRYHQFRFPGIWAAFTSFSYAYLNEIIENGTHSGADVDPIADLLIFNPLGILMFSSENVRYFFSNTLVLYDWSLQPMLIPINFNLVNCGEQYVLNYSLSQKWSLFFYWGTSGILGTTYSFSNLFNLSVGAGGIVNKLIEKRLIKSETFAKYVAPETIDGAIGIFIDKNHSLLMSLILTGPVYYNAQVNVYPLPISNKFKDLAFFIAAGELDSFQFGINFRFSPIGFGIII